MTKNYPGMGIEILAKYPGIRVPGLNTLVKTEMINLPLNFRDGCTLKSGFFNIKMVFLWYADVGFIYTN